MRTRPEWLTSGSTTRMGSEFNGLHFACQNTPYCHADLKTRRNKTKILTNPEQSTAVGASFQTVLSPASCAASLIQGFSCSSGPRWPTPMEHLLCTGHCSMCFCRLSSGHSWVLWHSSLSSDRGSSRPHTHTDDVEFGSVHEGGRFQLIRRGWGWGFWGTHHPGLGTGTHQGALAGEDTAPAPGAQGPSRVKKGLPRTSPHPRQLRGQTSPHCHGRNLGEAPSPEAPTRDIFTSVVQHEL